MIKKIEFTDIKKVSIDKKKPYEILEAHSTSNYISVYFNAYQRITVFRKCEKEYEYELEEIIEEEKNTTSGYNKNAYFTLSSITLTNLLYPITLLLIFCFSFFSYSEDIFIQCLLQNM